MTRGENNLKSVEGSLPCHPISFHWSDIRPWSSWPGYVADHRALKAPYTSKTFLLSNLKIYIYIHREVWIISET